MAIAQIVVRGGQGHRNASVSLEKGLIVLHQPQGFVKRAAGLKKGGGLLVAQTITGRKQIVKTFETKTSGRVQRHAAGDQISILVLGIIGLPHFEQDGCSEINRFV
jgi:hypothetical protein